jgi:glycosyltransferase involved in cell wall biosynthesis
VGGAETSISLMYEKLSKEADITCQYFSLAPKGVIAWRIIKQRLKNNLAIKVFPNFRYTVYSFGLLNRGYRYIFKQLLFYNIQKFNPDIVYLHSHMPSLKIFESFGLLDKVVLRMASGNSQFINISKDIISWKNIFNGIKAFNFLTTQNKSQFENFVNQIRFDSFFSKTFIVRDIGIDTDVFVKKYIKNLIHTRKIYVIGRLEGLPKRHELLLMAFEKAITEGNLNLSLNFIGEGFQRNELEEKVFNSKLSEKVRFLGFVERPNIPDTMNDSDFIFLASDSEGVSKSILEAMAMEKVIFASNIPENGFIEEGKTGFLVDNTEQAWMMAFRKAAEMEPCEIEKIGRNAREFILENFDAKKQAQIISKEFELLIN